MIKRKNVPDTVRGTQCPMRGLDRCAGQVCAWWVDDDDERGHCAVLDTRRETDGTEG